MDHLKNHHGDTLFSVIELTHITMTKIDNDYAFGEVAAETNNNNNDKKTSVHDTFTKAGKPVSSFYIYL
jgi:hypothetical protein